MQLKQQFEESDKLEQQIKEKQKTAFRLQVKLAKELNKAWHTIDRACLMLQIEGKIDGFRIGKMNLWRLK